MWSLERHNDMFNAKDPVMWAMIIMALVAAAGWAMALVMAYSASETKHKLLNAEKRCTKLHQELVSEREWRLRQGINRGGGL